MTDCPLRILLVEDNDLNRALVRAIMTRTSDPMLRTAELVEAHNLTQARAVLAHGWVDAVLLDIQLPDGSGLSLLDDFAGRADLRRPAIIAVTGGVLPEQRAAALAAGCDAIVEKPFIAAELTRALTDSITYRQVG
ncbi:MAG: two-component system, OmpR family, operon response regulator KdpE [Micromonosporaceae bacterium]|nr:two-component system, OmpR family, operon response regulator KdpE [Micromonosporaceae bacterium]